MLKIEPPDDLIELSTSLLNSFYRLHVRLHHGSAIVKAMVPSEKSRGCLRCLGLQALSPKKNLIYDPSTTAAVMYKEVNLSLFMLAFPYCIFILFFFFSDKTESQFHEV